jgi:tetratricopeptide (TPR) repeat protein
MACWAVLTLAALACQAAAPAPLRDKPAAKVLKAGDAAWEEREQDGRAERAIEYYKKAIVLDATSPEGYWKAARAHSWLGSQTKDLEQAAKLYLEGAEFAKLAVAADGNSLHAHYWLFIMYGLYDDARGVLQSLHMLDAMMKELDWLLAKDETFEAAGPHRFMGWVLLQIPAFKGGDVAKARKHLERAVELAPGCLLNHYYLAHVYVAQKEPGKATDTLHLMLKLPDDPGWSPENKEQRRLARLMLEELEKR